MHSLTMNQVMPGKTYGAARQLAGIIIAVILLTSCSTGKLIKAGQAFYQGQPRNALDLLEKEDSFADRDKLLFYMEKGAILHYSGRFEESIKIFLKASELIREQDVIRVGNQGASLLTTEWVTEYKGEHNERLWVHTYLMMNFLMIHKYESALVEAKQALKVLDAFTGPLENDYFTRAMIALCYENLGELNDAYIEYKKIALKDMDAVAPQLYRLAMELGLQEDAEKFKKSISGDISEKKRAPAEAIIFVGFGHGPVKVPSNIVIPPSIRFSFPRYESRFDQIDSIRFSESGSQLSAEYKALPGITSNMNALAKASLKDRAASIIAKETIRAAAKESIARVVGKKSDSPVLELFVRLFFLLLEEPDTRCWQTLPARQTLFRLPLAAGRHKINAIVYGRGGQSLKSIDLPEFEIGPGQKRFFSLRFGKAITFLGIPPEK